MARNSNCGVLKARENLTVGDGAFEIIAAIHQCRGEQAPPTAAFGCATFLCVFAAQPETTPSAAQITRTGTNTRERSRSPSPRRLLMRQYESLLQNSNNGFRASIENNNIFKWRIIIDGPPETPYAGFSFTALLEFPVSFPDYPPTLTFFIP
ncbi:hypothetical protein niasHT_009210 [Heterodera trifolii]|uniref:UBC core domain-containing protein n=1 Tax=Heterodera trifolii TaxID=157864 RepID=A0ABD2M0Q5_9BILA